MLCFGLVFCGYCYIAPYIIRDPGYLKLLQGTDYAGNLCESTNKFLYPIHRNGVGACTSDCPSETKAAIVNGFDPKDKEKMVCMSAEDFADFTLADEAGFGDFDLLTPVNAYKFGVCNYKYRTFKVANRCYFQDTDVAARYPYQLPTSKVVVLAQSFFASRLFLIFFCVLGAWVVASLYLFVLQTPMEFSEGKNVEEDNGEAQAVRTVWLLVWASGAAMLFMGSHMWYTAAFYDELAVDPRSAADKLALRVCAVVLWVLGAGWVWLLLRARHAVTLGVMLTMVSERALVSIGTNTVYWVSFAQMTMTTGLLFLMTFGIVNFSSMGKNDSRTDEATGASGNVFGYREDQGPFLCAVLVVFFAVWGAQFLSDVTALTTSLSVAGWFFTRDKTMYLPTFLDDYALVWQKHAGTVALGSLLHTFTDGPHRVLSTMEHVAASRVSKVNTSASPVLRVEQYASKGFLCCLHYGTFGLAENCLKYTSANAYASVAMFGTGYWESAKFSFYLVTRNVHRLGATVSVAQLIPFIGKVSTCALCTGAFYMMQVVVFSNQAISIVSATVVAAITSWLIAAQFMAPLSQASTTLLQCYMLDEELFLHNANERFAEKEMHAWVATYGGDFSAVQPS